MLNEIDVNRRFCVAPMLAHTDRHFRYLLRLISRRAMLYTEMITTGALLHGQPDRYLSHDPHEDPVALQLGGSDPRDMARCAVLAQRWGYAEVNVNVGCPSDRVKKGRFGACLMAEPGTVADCVEAMREACGLPITVKTRIGIDDLDSYEHLAEFAHSVEQAGCEALIVHARKAWLKGLSPRENRHVPPLRYDVVHRLKQDFARMEIILNGGLRSLEDGLKQLGRVDGVMFGRAVTNDPYLLAEVDRLYYRDPGVPPTRHMVLFRYLPYVRAQIAQGVPPTRITRHLSALFHGLPGARTWRRRLGEIGTFHGDPVAYIEKAAAVVGTATESLAHVS